MQKNKTGIILSLFILIIGVIFPFFLWKLGTDFNYYIKPIIWLFLLIVVVLFSKKRNRTFNFNKKAVLEIALIASLIYIISHFSLGIIIGYSKSPYDRSIVGILRNLWMFLPFIISREIIRDTIIKSSYKKSFLLPILITAICIFSDIPFANFEIYSKSIIDLIEFSIKTFIPAAISNTFLSYLCYKESYISSLTYRLPIKVINILTPVFPNDVFILTFLIDLTIPFITFFKIENLYNIVGITSIYEKNEIGVKLRRLALIIALIFTLTFTTRLLPISPIVIVSNSMSPYVEKGDLAIIKKIDSSKIKINDIIEYRLKDISVIHRVVNIKYTNNEILYITKGDNNNSNDSKPVRKNQINGILVGFIPKIGYPTVWIRNLVEQFGGIEVKEGDRI